MIRLCRVIVSVAMLAAPPLPLGAQVSPGPLARSHQELEGPLKCVRCHGAGSEGMEAKCTSCHRDIQWLAERGRGVHGNPPAKDTKCASCHPDHAGIDFALIKWAEGAPERFEHRRAHWSLELSHAKLQCTKCHTAVFRTSLAAKLAPAGKSNWTGLESSCASCHEDVHRGALGVRCTTCHDAGRWAVTPGFNHDTTGYPLTGRHSQVACDKCHLSAHLSIQRDGSGHAIPVYKPVPHSVCTSCHDDVHKGRYGPACTTCHSTKSFAEISGTGFDHGRTAYPLRGKHATVACGSCHRDFTTDTGRRPASGTCAICHAPDPHAGTAMVQEKPVDCAACHTERGFAASTFPLERHQASRYPLEGKHAAVRCGACHSKDGSPDAAARLGASRVAMRPVFRACTSCHADDHGRQLADRPGKGECAECHRVAGWKPSSFSREAHARLTLPLDGRHGEIACASCHGADRKGLKPLAPRKPGLGKVGFAFKGIESRCSECHVDPHGGRFESGGQRPAAGGCLACHDSKSFRPAAVDVAAHDRFRFRLRGAHRATPCSSCHKELAGPVSLPRPSTLVATGEGKLSASRFDADSTCASCHASIHGNQFDQRKDRGRCDGCHSEESFAPATRFDHDRDASFALGKGHQRVACAACHRSIQAAGGVTRVVYRPLSGKCENCHLRRPGSGG